jgi:hypothetical protein
MTHNETGAEHNGQRLGSNNEESGIVTGSPLVYLRGEERTP